MRPHKGNVSIQLCGLGEAVGNYTIAVSKLSEEEVDMLWVKLAGQKVVQRVTGEPVTVGQLNVVLHDIGLHARYTWKVGGIVKIEVEKLV